VLCSSLSWQALDLQKAEASTAWQVLGQSVLTLEFPDDQAAIRIDKFNQKLSQILPRLNPNQNWVIDIVTTYVPRLRPLKLKSALIRLQRYNLIFINENDAEVHGTSVQNLADSWVQSLGNLFSQPNIKQTLVAAIGMPKSVTYGGATYYLKPEITGDRGLFRTSGARVNDKVVYWEVPADNKAYQVSADSTYKSLEPPSVAMIYLLNRNMQFLPYARQKN